MGDFALNLRSAVQMARGGTRLDLRMPKNQPATSTATSPVSKHSPASAVYGKKKMRHMMEEIGHEMKENPPKIVAHTKRKFGAKRAAKQTTAILLAKARRGAK